MRKVCCIFCTSSRPASDSWQSVSSSSTSSRPAALGRYPDQHSWSSLSQTRIPMLRVHGNLSPAPAPAPGRQLQASIPISIAGLPFLRPGFLCFRFMEICSYVHLNQFNTLTGHHNFCFRTSLINS